MKPWEKYLPLATKLRAALISAESSGNPKAIGPDTAGDTKTLADNAKGLMQLMDATGREWHAILDIKEPYDPFNGKQNILIGTSYLAWLLEQFAGDVHLALAAYNHGIGSVRKKQKRWGKNFRSIYPRLPLETQNYVLKIGRKMGLA